MLGQNLKQKWQAIKTQADTLEAHKDYQAAKPLRLQEKDIALKKWKKKSEQYATAAYDLGINYYNLANIDSSLFFFQQAVEAREQLKDSTAKYAKALTAYTRLHIQMGNYEKAAPLCKNLYQIAPKIFAENDPDYLNILNLVGVFYQAVGEQEKAIPIFQKGIMLSEPLFERNPMPHIRLLANLGKSYLDLGRNREAIRSYNEVLEKMKEKSLIYIQEYLLIINNLALAYSNIGKYQLGMNLYRQYLIQTEKTDYNYTAGLQNMGELYLKMEQYDSSLIVLKQALNIVQQTYKNLHPDYVALQVLIATNYNDMGKFEEALILTKESLEMFEKLNMKNTYYYISTQDLLSNIYLKIGRDKEALISTKEGLQLKKELLGENLDYARGLLNISTIYIKFNKYDTALICAQEALELCNKKEAPFYYYETIYSELGNIFRLKNQYDSALYYLEKSLTIKQNELGKNSQTYATTLFSFSEVYQDMGYFSKASNYLTQNNQFFYQYYQKQAASLSEKDRRELWNTIKGNYESMQSLCFLAKDSVPQLITQAYNNQLNTGGILLRETENIANAIRKNGDEKLVSLYSDWLYQKNLVTDWATWDSTQLKLGNIDLKAETDKVNEMEQQLAQQSQVFRNAIDTTSVQWQQVQASLQKGEASVEIVQFRTYEKLGFSDTVHYAAFILTPETKNAPIYVPLPFGNQMENEWAKEYQIYINEKPKDMVSFARYFKPILAVLKDAKHIYFAADGIYHKLNLNTLLDEDGKYLVEKYSLHRIASTRDLAKRKYSEEFPANPTAALFGNPTFKISEIEHDSLAAKIQKSGVASTNLYREIVEERDQFSDLPAAKEEVIAVTNILKKQNFQVKTYLEKEALEEEVQNLKHPSVVLFATHGKFDETPPKPGTNYHFSDNPMYKSKLYFVGARNAILAQNDSAQTKHEDGILYAAEAALLDLQGTDLVILSACETGLGTIQNGEGVWGLQRAFRLAGAKNLIMSLWKVDDKASQQFMTSFFENWLEKKMPKYAAFQQAQLSLKKKYPDEPKKWGGFILLEGL